MFNVVLLGNSTINITNINITGVRSDDRYCRSMVLNAKSISFLDVTFQNQHFS